MRKSNELTNKNHNRRFGSGCGECNKKLGRYRLDGTHNGKSISFCSIKCHDLYMVKQDSN